MNPAITPDVLFAQRFEYHRNLLSRRWQYFATFLVVNGILLNVLPKLAETGNLRLAFCAVPIILSHVFLRLTGRLRRRLRINAQAVNDVAEEEILEVSKPGAFGVRGISFWVYLAYLVMTIPWLYPLCELSIWLGFALAALHVAHFLVLE